MSWDDEDLDAFTISKASQPALTSNWDDEDQEEEAHAKPTENKPAPPKEKKDKDKGKGKGKGKEASAPAVVVKDERLADPIAEKKRQEMLVRASDMENAKELFSGFEDDQKDVKQEAKPKEAPKKDLSKEVKEAAIRDRDIIPAEKDIFADVDETTEKKGKKKLGPETSIDASQPRTEDDFDQLLKAIKKKFTTFEKSPHYKGFLKGMFRELSGPLTSEDVKQLTQTLNVILNEKLKQEKQGDKKPKKKVVKKVAAQDVDEDMVQGEYDDYNDFLA